MNKQLFWTGLGFQLLHIGALGIFGVYLLVASIIVGALKKNGEENNITFSEWRKRNK